MNESDALAALAIPRRIVLPFAGTRPCSSQSLFLDMKLYQSTVVPVIKPVITRFVNLDTAHHLLCDCLDMLIVDVNTTAAVVDLGNL